MIIRHVLRPRCDQARWWVQVSLMPGAAPASDKDEGSRQGAFRGSIAQRLISLSTLRSGRSPAPTQDSLPAAGPALPDGIGYPQGSCKRFHICDAFLLFRASWRNVRPSF